MKITKVSVGLARFIENENGDKVPVPIEFRQIQTVHPEENLFFHYAGFFLNSAESLKTFQLEQGNGFQLGNVPGFLYLHGLELFAKGKLFSINNLGKNGDDFGRYYGHDLNKILDDLKNAGINWDKGLTQDEIGLIKKTGNDYKRKMYNYADGINHANPLKVDIVEISSTVDKIIDNLQ